MRLVHKHDEQIEELRKLTQKLESSPTYQAMEKEDAAKLVKNAICWLKNWKH